MQKTFLVIGHTGFLGKHLLNLIDTEYPESMIYGISKDTIDARNYPHIHFEQFLSMEDFKSNYIDKIDFLFFLAHGQNSGNPSNEEFKLTDSFINLVRKNEITSPIVLIQSAGNGSQHLNSRMYFNKKVRESLQNRIIEIRSSVIASPGSISYEIPFRCVNRLSIIPEFPWYRSSVSLTHVEEIMKIFKKIINVDDQNIYFPANITTSYGKYIKQIAKENGKRIKFIYFPFNEFFIVPYLVSRITSLPYKLVRNLMKSLSVPSVV